MRRELLMAMFLVVTAASPAFAQYTLTTLASFNGNNGDGPTNDLILSGTTLYGTAYTGGGGGAGTGTVSSVPTTGGTPTVLASFNYTDGSGPSGRLVLSGSTLYGTTDVGGANGIGTVYSVPVAGGTPADLVSFDGTTDGYDPVGGLVLSGSALYGTTLGSNLFSVPVTGGTPKELASFTGGFGYAQGLVPSGSTLYGTIPGAGPSAAGQVFSVPTAGGTPTILASFNGANGSGPVGALILSGGILYGTMNSGGSNNDGTVFSLPITGGTPTPLASFNGADGKYPMAALVLSGSTLYGTTSEGGANGDGEVFSLPITGGTPTVLASFNVTGQGPSTGLVEDTEGDFYGTSGGANDNNIVFEIAPTTMTITSVAPAGSINLGAGAPGGGLFTTGSGGHYSPVSYHLPAAATTGYFQFGGIQQDDTGIILLKFTNTLTGLDPALNPSVLGDIEAFIAAHEGTGITVTALLPAVQDAFTTAFDVQLSFTAGPDDPYLSFDFSTFTDSSVPAGDLTVTDIGLFGLVPEPTSAGLLAIGSLTLLRRTRRLTPRMVAG